MGLQRMASPKSAQKTAEKEPHPSAPRDSCPVVMSHVTHVRESCPIPSMLDAIESDSNSSSETEGKRHCGNTSPVTNQNRPSVIHLAGPSMSTPVALPLPPESARTPELISPTRTPSVV